MTTERKRDGGIGAPAWWAEVAADKKRELGLRNEDIAAKVAEILGVKDIDHSRISRCLSGTTATVPLLDAISAVLGIPSPVALASSLAEALAIAGARHAVSARERALSSADAKIDELRSESRSLRQGTTVRSVHGGKEGRASGGMGPRRRDAGQA